MGTGRALSWPLQWGKLSPRVTQLLGAGRAPWAFPILCTARPCVHDPARCVCSLWGSYPRPHPSRGGPESGSLPRPRHSAVREPRAALGLFGHTSSGRPRGLSGVTRHVSGKCPSQIQLPPNLQHLGPAASTPSIHEAQPGAGRAAGPWEPRRATVPSLVRGSPWGRQEQWEATGGSGQWGSRPLGTGAVCRSLMDLAGTPV